MINTIYIYIGVNAQNLKKVALDPYIITAGAHVGAKKVILV